MVFKVLECGVVDYVVKFIIGLVDGFVVLVEEIVVKVKVVVKVWVWLLQGIKLVVVCILFGVFFNFLEKIIVVGVLIGGVEVLQ